MNDMTHGDSLKQIVGFGLPMLIGNIFQQIYNMADTIIVGRYLGEKALAGVGSTGSLTFFLLALVIGLCSGAGLITAQCYGAGEIKKMAQTTTALIWVAGILSVCISFAGYFGAEFFLRILSVPEDVMEYAVPYVRIVCVFVLGSVLHNGAASLLRSIGDSKTPLSAVIVSSIVNIVLDLVFILKCNLGVSGAAYATVIAQWISAVICIGKLVIIRKQIGVDRLELLPRRFAVMQILKTGCPSAMQSCMISLGAMSVQRLVNSYGTAVMAAYVAARKIDGLALQAILSVGTALSVFTGQNIAKGQYERIRKGLYSTLKFMMLMCGGIALTVIVLREQFMRLFLDAGQSGDAIKIGAEYLLVIGIAYLIAGVMQCYQNVIKGAGDVNACFIAGITELAGRIVFAYLLSSRLGAMGIWIATPISYGCGCVIPLMRYYSGRWKVKKLI